MIINGSANIYLLQVSILRNQWQRYEPGQSRSGSRECRTVSPEGETDIDEAYEEEEKCKNYQHSLMATAETMQTPVLRQDEGKIDMLLYCSGQKCVYPKRTPGSFRPHIDSKV